MAYILCHTFFYLKLAEIDFFLISMKDASLYIWFLKGEIFEESEALTHTLAHTISFLQAFSSVDEIL